MHFGICQSCASFVTHMRVGNMAPHARPFALSMRWTLGAGHDAKTKGRVSCNQSAEAPAPWFK